MRAPRPGDRRPGRGFTIVEMMVVCVVAFVILSLLADVFITALQRTNDGRLRVDMQQRAIFAVTRWERDIDRTAARAMVLKPGEPLCVAMTEEKKINDDGTVFWGDQIVCWAYKSAERLLLRDTYPPKQPAFAGEPSPNAPYLPTFSELDSLIEETSGAEKIMCQDVEEFDLTNSQGESGPLDQQPLIFKLKLRRPLSRANNFAEFTIERRYTLRNTY